MRYAKMNLLKFHELARCILKKKKHTKLSKILKLIVLLHIYFSNSSVYKYLILINLSTKKKSFPE